MDFDHENVRPVINEDRLSSLPDELIHHILSSMDSTFAVQTSLLSSRWKRLWTAMPCLNFASHDFDSLPKFSKFVTHFLSNRNHEIDVTSLNLYFRGAASQYFVRKIANYVFAHNVQELNVVIFPKKHHEFPPSFFSSQSLKQFFLRSYFLDPCLVPKTQWDFPALTSLHLDEVTFRDDNTDKSVDLFSKCVNLKNLTLCRFHANYVEVFDIITPRLSNLTLVDGSSFEIINLVAPELENLTVINCEIKNLNAPPAISSLCYTGYSLTQLSKDGFHSLNKAAISLSIYSARKPYKEEVARKTIDMLHEVHSARYLTINADIVECISAFPELISHHPSPFSSLICLNVDTSMRKDAYKIKMSTEARNFLLENSPNATFSMELPEAPPKRTMKQKEARKKEKAQLVADIESHVTELQASLEVVKRHIGTREKVQAAFKNLMAELQVLTKQEKDPAELQMQVDQRKVQTENHKEEMQMQVERGELPIDSRKMRLARIEACVGEMRALVNQEKDDVITILSKNELIISLLKKLPKRQRAEFEARYSRQLEESEAQMYRLRDILTSEKIVDAYEKFLSDNILTFLDVSGSSISLASQPSSSSAIIPTSSTSNINSMP